VSPATSLSQACRCSLVLVTTTAKFFPEDERDAAQPKDAVFPEGFQGSPKLASSRSRGVLEVVNTTAALAFSNPTGRRRRHPSRKPVGHLRPEHPVHPALQDSRRLAPPVGVTMTMPWAWAISWQSLFQRRVEEGFPLEFGSGQDGVEVFLVEVMKLEFMPWVLQGVHRGGGDGRG